MTKSTLRPEADWRQFRLHKLNEAPYRHALLLLFWPVFGLLFQYVERFYPVDHYYPIYSPLDDLIPFHELFVIPYLFWFVFLAGMVVFTFFFDSAAFRRMMVFIILTFGVTIVIYFLFPNCQELRPAEFPRDNFLTDFMAGFYQFDTNTNVCPSLHVIGAVASMLAVLDCRHLQHCGWKIGSVIAMVLISLSTVFLKQHSIIDVAAAVPLCLVGWLAAYRCKRSKGTP